MERGIQEFERLFAAENTTIFRGATKRVSNSLVRLSPVAEGEYVAEWDAAIGNWPVDTDQPDDPKKTRTRKRLQQVFSSAEFGDVVFFENTDPVAVRLEFGYSDQAPQGVVRLTTRRWRGFVRGEARAAQNRVRKRVITTNA